MRRKGLAGVSVPKCSRVKHPISSGVPGAFIAICASRFPSSTFPSTCRRRRVGRRATVLDLLELG